MGKLVSVPVKRIAAETNGKPFRADKDPGSIRTSPYQDVIKYALENNIAVESVPSRWIRYGDAILLVLQGDIATQRKIAGAYARSIGVSSVYRIDGGIRGIHREPTLRLIYGPGGEVTHLENGIRFVFDPARIMFSPGNVNERVSMKAFAASGKRVLDMFSGIGYFSLPLAKYQKPEFIQCCEINPVSAYFLQKSAEANKVAGIIRIFRGDSRTLSSEVLYDIIIMGNFQSTKFFVKALSLIGPGGLIIMHHLVSTDRLDDVRTELIRRIGRFSLSSELLDSHIVKSVAPNYYHVSTTLRINYL
ncbi:MAG: class I SAM-dependent methyltransferase [Thermoplasmataceae archaeon]